MWVRHDIACLRQLHVLTEADRRFFPENTKELSR